MDRKIITDLNNRWHIEHLDDAMKRTWGELQAAGVSARWDITEVGSSLTSALNVTGKLDYEFFDFILTWRGKEIFKARKERYSFKSLISMGFSAAKKQIR